MIECRDLYQESQAALAHLVFSYLGSGEEAPLLSRQEGVEDLAELKRRSVFESLKGKNTVPERGTSRAAKTIMSLVRKQRAPCL